jgi:hypothetical protein
MKQAVAPKTQGRRERLKCGSEKAKTKKAIVAAARP